jgi:hypothetical protein
MSRKTHRGESFDALRLAEAIPQLKERHMRAAELAAFWRISVTYAEGVLWRMRQAGHLCRLRTGSHASVWMLPEQFAAAKAEREKHKRSMYVAKIKRSNERQNLRRRGIDPDAPDVDDFTAQQRIVKATEAKPLRVTAPRWVFDLAEA